MQILAGFCQEPAFQESKVQQHCQLLRDINYIYILQLFKEAASESQLSESAYAAREESMSKQYMILFVLYFHYKKRR